MTGKKWSKQSREIAAERKHLPVIELINEHFEIVSEFNRVLLVRIGVHSNRSFRDIARIRQARKIFSHRNSLAIILQIAIPKRLNPYEYLYTWFTEAELANIYTLPDHSKEQVDYIISLRDPIGLCDDDTRRNLYKLFSVAD